MSLFAVLIILNCKKYEYKAKYQKEHWLKYINIPYFHIIGDPTIDKYIIDTDNKILYVKCMDDYCSLPNKVVLAMKAIQETYNPEYIFKTDDDQMVDKTKYFNVICNILKSKRYDYGGKMIDVQDHYSSYHIIHNELPKNLFLKKGKYCSGRFYFVSSNAIKTIINNEQWISQQVIEDHAIGCVLNNYEIMNINTDLTFYDIL